MGPGECLSRSSSWSWSGDMPQAFVPGRFIRHAARGRDGRIEPRLGALSEGPVPASADRTAPCVPAYQGRAKGFAVLVRPGNMRLISLLQRGVAHGSRLGPHTRAVMSACAGDAGREDP